VKFFFYSVKGFSLSLAQRVQAEGNEVLFYQQDRNPKSKGRVGKGLVPLADRVRIDRDAVVVFDFTGAGKRADELRKSGYAVVGGGTFNDALEHNRLFATQLMKAAGIKVPLTVGFRSIQEGIDFVEHHPKPLVFKPSGEFPSALTIVADDNAELAKEMERVQRLEGDAIDFELQERVEGIEVSVEGWFNGQEWIHHSINSTLEEKRFLTGSLGPNTGCMGNVVFFYRHARPRIAKETLFRLTPFLRKVGYVGPLDINTKGGYALEFTPRFGYDAIQTMVELQKQDVGKMLSDVARGQVRAWHPSFEFAIGVTMTIPPFPNDNVDELAKSQGTPIRMPDALLKRFHLGDAMLNDEGELVTAGNDGVVGVMTAVSQTVTEARRVVYQRVREVKVPDVQYRLDIGERAVREIPELLRSVGDGD
jgi:phosphoribosylamine--glycine ligase